MFGIQNEILISYIYGKVCQPAIFIAIFTKNPPFFIIRLMP
jgi:hypothetical protein